jgi:type II secretion system protein I
MIDKTRGFSLLEVLVALAIMGIAITLVLQLFSSNLHSLSLSGDMVSASAAANTRMRELLMESPMTEGVWSETKENRYRLEISVAEVLKQRTENLPLRLLDVALTVYWQEGLKEKKLTLRTMKMVDKAKPL